MLTKSQELAIEYRVQGLSPTEAVLKAYNCKDRNTAGSLAYQLFKKPEVDKRLIEKQSIQDNKTAQITADFIQQVKDTIPPQSVIDKLKEVIDDGGSREKLTAIDQYLKIIGGYKESKGKIIGLFDKIGGLE